MFIEIDPNRSLPIFSQIVEGVRLSVALGRTKSGDRIPSIRDLAVELRINHNTVAKAYQELERSGIVEVRRGMGYFIADTDGGVDKKEKADLLDSRIDELISTGIELGFSPKELNKAIDKKIRKLEQAT